LAPFLYAEFKAQEWRWWFSGIRFGGVRLESTLPRTAFYGLYWKLIGWFMLLSVAMGGFIGILGFLVTKMGGANLAKGAAPVALSQSIPLVIMTGIGYLALILSLNVVMRLYLQRDVWARVSQTVQLHGIEAAADVAARGEPANALGEGFADGLDVVGF
jgi:hypothetical protein